MMDLYKARGMNNSRGVFTLLTIPFCCVAAVYDVVTILKYTVEYYN